MAIVTTHYRYKRPPRKRKAVALEAPAIVTAKSSRRPNLEAKAATEVPRAPVSREEGAAAQPSTPIVTTRSRRHPPLEGTEEEAAAEVIADHPSSGGEAAQPSTPREAARVEPPPANDDRKSAIVTIKRKSRFGDAPDLTPEEHHRRGEAAAALWSSLVDRATAREGKSAAVSAESSSPAPKPAIVVTARKRRSAGPHLPMELPLSRKPIERDGDEYKRLKAAMARRMRGE